MSTKSKYENALTRLYEGSTSETIFVAAPVWFKEDFLQPALDTTNLFTLRDTGGGTEALVEDAPNGVVALALDATSEAQLAGIDWNDKRTLVLNQGLNFEARFRFSVVPTTGAIACIGLCGDHNATADTVAESIWFRADATGAVTVETDDVTNEQTKVATGTTLTTSDWIVARIDCSVTTDVKFYINGARVAGSTTFNMSAVPTLALQPVARINKASGTGVGTIQVDYIAVWQKRS